MSTPDRSISNATYWTMASIWQIQRGPKKVSKSGPLNGHGMVPSGPTSARMFCCPQRETPMCPLQTAIKVLDNRVFSAGYYSLAVRDQFHQTVSPSTDDSDLKYMTSNMQMLMLSNRISRFELHQAASTSSPDHLTIQGTSLVSGRPRWPTLMLARLHSRISGEPFTKELAICKQQWLFGTIEVA